MYNNKYLALMTISAVMFFCPAAQGQWQVTPSIAVGLQYDDNVFLNTVANVDQSADGYAADVGVDFSYSSQITEFQITPRVFLDRYRDASSLDSTDQFVNFDFRRSGQRSQFRLRGDYSEETIRRGEKLDTGLDDDDLVEVPTDDSGVVFSVQDRQRIRVVPEFSHRISQKSLIGARLEYLDSSYDATAAEDLRDFSDTRARLFYEYGLNERDVLALTAGANRYESEADTRDVEGYGFGLGFRRSISERTTFGINVGAEQTDTVDGTDEDNVVGDISLNHRLQTTNLFAAYRRSVNGSGFGDVSVRDMLMFNVKHDLSAKSTLGVGARAYQTNALQSGNQNFVEQDYIQFRALYTWRLTRIFSIDFDYRYTQLERSDRGGSEDSNQFNLWFRYRPLRQ